MALADAYKATCADLQVKPNSAVTKMLVGADASTLTTLDLRGNMVGTKGAGAVAKFASDHLPNLTTLNLSGNNVGSPATSDLYTYLVKHPALTSLDVSNNDVRLGGPQLVDLVKRNKKITALNIENTFLRPLFERLIALHLKNNQAAADGGNTSSSSNNTKKDAQKKASIAPAFKDDENKTGNNNGDDEDNNEAEDSSPFTGGGEEEGGGGGFASWGESHVVFETNYDTGKKVNRRSTVSAGHLDETEIDTFEPDVNEKEPKVRDWLLSILERHQLFSHLDDYELLVAVDALAEAERGEGETLFEEGDEDGDMFYIVASGEVETTVNGEHQHLYKRGETIADLMLMYGSTYKETATCKEDPTTVYMLDRKTYRCVLSKASKKKRAMYEGFLSEVPFLKGLTKSELLQLADALKSCSFEPGQKMISYGSTGEAFFLIVEGTVEVYGRNDAGESIKVCEFNPGENVGELEFINNHKCVADCVAKGHLRAAKMNRRHFEMVMGPVKEVLARTAANSEVYGYYREQLEKMDKTPEPPKVEGEEN